MAGYTLSGLETDVRNWAEVDSTVFTGAVLSRFIENAEYRIAYDLPMDSDRVESSAQFAQNFNTITVPAECLFVRGVLVFDSTTDDTIKGQYLLKRDVTFMQEYQGEATGPVGSQTGQDVKGLPKYYAMFGGATGTTSSTSGALYVSPTPDQNYLYTIFWNKLPPGLQTQTSGTFVSKYFPQGLLYATLVEAFTFLKGPADMLTLYEQKYKQELQKFASLQIGRRRRDDYTDGTIRIPIESPPQ